MAHEHSKGPFTLEIEGDQATIYAADGYDMASVPLDPECGRPGEDEANARLFAASYGMLEARKGLVKDATFGGDPGWDSIAIAEIFIARAAGKE